MLTLIAGYHHSDTARRFYVGPLYVSDSTDSSTRLLMPLFVTHLTRKTEIRTSFVLPLLFFSRGSPEKSITTVAGLFWRRRDISSATTLVLPLFIDVHDFRQSRTTVLLPLFVRHSNEVTGESLWLAPLYYRHVTAETTTNVFFPLFWDFKREGRRTTVLFPFFAHWTRATYAATYIFPIFYYRKGILAGEDDGTWRLFIPPLFDAAVERPGDFRWEILGGLFGKERIGRNHYMKLFFFTFETQKASAAQTSWVRPAAAPVPGPPRPRPGDERLVAPQRQGLAAAVGRPGRGDLSAVAPGGNDRIQYQLLPGPCSLRGVAVAGVRSETAICTSGPCSSR